MLGSPHANPSSHPHRTVAFSSPNRNPLHGDSMIGLNEISIALKTAKELRRNAGRSEAECQKPEEDLAKLKSLIANVLRAGYDGDINPNHPIGPGMQAEITSALQKLNSFVKSI